MSEPFIFVTHHRINDGGFEGIKALSKSFRELVEASGTGLLAFHFHISADGTEVSKVQVHTDAASMDAYLPIAREKIAVALALSETSRIDVFGTPGPVAAEVVHRNAEQGVRVNVKPSHLGGFTRCGGR